MESAVVGGQPEREERGDQHMQKEDRTGKKDKLMIKEKTDEMKQH